MGDYLVKLLSTKGYKTSLHPTAGRFFDAMLKTKPDVVLLDMQLPGMDGKEIIRVLRNSEQTRNLVIIAMSGALKETADVVAGFHSGADEYLVKPFDPDFLLVRIDGFLRRTAASAPPEEVLRFSDVSVFLDQRVCRVKANEIELTRLEFDLLVYLIRQSNRVLTRSILLEQVWGGDPTMTTRTVDKHIENLRRKLGDAGRRIEAVIRVGYILRNETGRGR
jgi:DNA-binding response OmpR family regulator